MENRKELEEIAKRKGVELVPSPSAGQALPPPAPMPAWMARVMPEATPMLASLKAQLTADVWADIAGNLRKGGGYVVDLSTGIALGSPPPKQWVRGRIEQRDGLTVMRVRPVEGGSGPAPTPAGPPGPPPARVNSASHSR